MPLAVCCTPTLALIKLRGNAGECPSHFLKGNVVTPVLGNVNVGTLVAAKSEVTSSQLVRIMSGYNVWLFVSVIP